MEAAEVLVVVYDGVQLLDAAGPVEVFDGAARALGGGYRVRLASAGGRDVLTSSGVRLSVHADLGEVPPGDLDTLLVAGGWGYVGAAADRELTGAVRRLAGRARRVGSVCTGAFVLAAAGLLEGRRATTHWAFCAELERSYPAVRVEPDAMFVRDGPLATSAGVTAGADLALALVEEDHGAELARLVAKWLVMFLQRPGGQLQFSTGLPGQPPARDPLGALLRDITARPAADFSVPAMAGRLSMSPRHFSRVFARQTGVSPGRYVERARVAAARARLEAGDDGVETVARQSGFGTAETMRRSFLRELGIPPSACRARFARAAPGPGGRPAADRFRLSEGDGDGRRVRAVRPDDGA
jgi:transcriptional regulator GlxA family with amidase domain